MYAGERQIAERSSAVAAPLSRSALVRAAATLLAVIAVFWAVAFLAPASPAAAAVGTPNLELTASFPAGEPAQPRITATAAILIDADTGEILFSHNANARLPMASTTKIMTALLVLDSLDLDTEVTVSANAVATIGSKTMLVQGEVLTVEQLLNALLVVSGNDAGVALAEATAGSVKAFVEKMNAKADALGLTNTNFVNPCGLNNTKHFSSAKDLATLAQYALGDPVFSGIVDTVLFSLPPIPPVAPSTKATPRDFDNQNELLHRYAWVTGVKTGSTPYAKYCVVASGTVENVSLIAVILGAQEDETRWKEAKALFDYGFGLYPRTVLVNTGQLVTELDVGDLIDRPARLVTDRAIVARLSRTDVAKSTIRLDRALTLPVNVGDVFGTVEFTLEDRSLGSAKLLAAQSIQRPTIEMILDHWRSGSPVEILPSDRGAAQNPR
jgi:serine-type D-Ala-D-Ala carboxypeptidase (penicillin-binding protein 5/6)